MSELVCSVQAAWECVTHSWWNEPAFKCTSRCEGASRQQPDPSKQQRPSGQILARDTWWMEGRHTQFKTPAFHWKCGTFNVLSRFLVSLWKTTPGAQSQKGETLMQQNKILKPAIMGTRFPSEGTSGIFFLFFKALPKCPEAYQIWIRLDRLEWVSNQSTAVFLLKSRPAFYKGLKCAKVPHTPTHAVHGTTCAAIQRYGRWHIFAIRKFSFWFAALGGEFIINLKWNMNNRRRFRETVFYFSTVRQTEWLPFL